MLILHVNSNNLINFVGIIIVDQTNEKLLENHRNCFCIFHALEKWSRVMNLSTCMYCTSSLTN